MSTFTRWVLRHKLLVALFWLTVTVVGILMVARATGALSKQFSSPGQESSMVNETILRTYGIGTPPVVLVVTLPNGTTVDSPGITDQLTGALAAVATAAPGAHIVSYPSTGDHAFVSQDGRTTFALVDTPTSPVGFADGAPGLTQVQAAVRDVRIAGAPFHITGTTALSSASATSGGGSVPPSRSSAGWAR
ncbi:MAG: hypothetical protein ACR2JW_21630 [Thermomicrobiales bacterium]